MKKTMFSLFLCISLCQVNAQTKERSIKFGLGASFFNLNESFDDLFFYNNSSPIYLGLKIKDKYRIESIINVSLIEHNETSDNLTRGSATLGFDFIRELFEKFHLYYGPRIGYNTNETLLTNAHIAGEYYFHKRWSVSAEIGCNYLLDDQNYFQTNSNLIVRFYL